MPSNTLAASLLSSAMAPLTSLSTVTVQSYKQRRTKYAAPPSAFKQLPGLPTPAPSRSLSPLPLQSTHSFSSIAALPMTSPAFLAAVKKPAVFARLTARLDWTDILALFNTCRDCRNLFRDDVLRDILLCRLVPGYAAALRFRNLANYHDVPISLHDLDLLLISLKLPLHRYPTHALRTLTALYPTLEGDYITTKLVALSLAHSRFVLLLQALMHSSSSPLPPEQDVTSRLFSSRSSTVTRDGRHLNFPAPLSYLKEQQQQHNVLESHTSAPLPVPAALSKRSKRHSLPARSKSVDPSYSHLPHAVRPSADSLSSMISINNTYGEPHETTKGARRRSIFRKSVVTPPPPDEPRALRVYSSTWRKSAWNNGYNPNQPANLDDLASLYGSNEFIPERPKRRFAAESTNVSSDSSVSSSPTTSPSPLPRMGFESGSSSGGRNSPPTPPLTLTRPVMSPLPINMIRMTSPHDLHLATFRVRAPILRVFVPCTKLEVDSDGVMACERHLVDAGLWEHLSTGDVVCNLGYIPPTSSDDSLGGGAGGDAAAAGLMMEEDNRDSSPTRFGGSSSSRYGSSIPSPAVSGAVPNSGPSAPGHNTPSTSLASNSRKWLLFNGECLVPYTAPDILPIDNPLSLPSPYYYAHLTPGNTSFNGGGSNFRFWIKKFPPLLDETPQMAMVNVASRVKSIKAPNGWIEARKWAWTARFRRVNPRVPNTDSSMEGSHHSHSADSMSRHHQSLALFGAEIGEGWFGEWVLEGEGTSEGRQQLLDIVCKGDIPGGSKEWEFVRERSGNGRIWLRMVS
ncbi:hypothetical protein AN958_05161 [Leucoagaricus sp. SymC.cos]|nr:hypothetical protein AN958_05161 [Leucoagaricus sp. SymC.cos]